MSGEERLDMFQRVFPGVSATDLWKVLYCLDNMSVDYVLAALDQRSPAKRSANGDQPNGDRKYML